MPKQYNPNKVPEEARLNPKIPSASNANNERYMNMASGSLGNGVMGHASKVMHVDPMPDYDIKRVQYQPSSYRDTPKEAFDYKY